MATTDYTAQAQAWLDRYGYTLTIKRAKGKAPAWADAGADHGNRYRVALSGENGVARFDFWGSINDRNNGTDPTPYDVLACISSDIYCPDTFEDFCDEYGDDPDSRKAFALWKRCSRFADDLRRVIPDGPAREALAEIQ